MVGRINHRPTTIKKNKEKVLSNNNWEGRKSSIPIEKKNLLNEEQNEKKHSYFSYTVSVTRCSTTATGKGEPNGRKEELHHGAALLPPYQYGGLGADDAQCQPRVRAGTLAIQPAGDDSLGEI